MCRSLLGDGGETLLFKNIDDEGHTAKAGEINQNRQQVLNRAALKNIEFFLIHDQVNAAASSHIAPTRD